MKMRYLRDENGKIDRRYMIAKDGSYIRDKETGKKLIPYISQGYRVITITISELYYNQIRISRLQWWAWRGLVPKGYHIHHKKWNKDKEINAKLKQNDDINNLQCLSHSKHRTIHTAGKNNHFYKKHHTEESKNKMRINHPSMKGEKNHMFGISQFGEKNPKAILTEKKVKKIRYLKYKKNWSMRKITNKFEVSASCIQHIIQGHTWNPDNLTKQELIQQTISK